MNSIIRKLRLFAFLCIIVLNYTESQELQQYLCFDQQCYISTHLLSNLYSLTQLTTPTLPNHTEYFKMLVWLWASEIWQAKLIASNHLSQYHYFTSEGDYEGKLGMSGKVLQLLKHRNSTKKTAYQWRFHMICSTQ